MIEYVAIIRTSSERQEIESQRKELLDFIKKDGVDLDKVTVIGEADKARRESIKSYSEKIRMIRSNIRSLESSDEIRRLVDIHADLASLGDKLLMKDIIKRQITKVWVKLDNIGGKCYSISMEGANGGVKNMLYYPNRTGRPRYWVMVNGEWKADSLYNG